MIRVTLITLLLFTCACIKLSAQVNIITTIAGNGLSAYPDTTPLGEVPATNAEVRTPEGLCLDNYGNAYIAEAGYNRVRKVNLTTGIITTVAGTGAHSFSGDNGPATAAEVLSPCAVFTDTSGNVYIADAGNNRVRKITISTEIITTIVGSGPDGLGTGSFSGDGGMATNATLNEPTGLCLDKLGNIYIADYENNRIRRVDASTGIITTVAGNGSTVYSGDGVQATAVGINGPIEVFVNNAGDIFICDQYYHAIREVNGNTGIITTVAGNGTAGYTGDDGPATKAQLNQPCGVYVDNLNNIFVAEYGDGIIRRVDGATGIITTVAGIGTRGYSGDGGPATDAMLRCGDVFLDKYGTIFIADEDNNRIRIVRDTTLKVAVPKISEQTIKILPNPVHNQLTIEHAEGSQVSICNLLGQQVYSVTNVSDKEVLNVQNLVPGIYIIQIMNKDGTAEKIRLQKE